ncbi:MAG: tRNA-dihydrouridine synthase [Pseudomonadota bacterium]
MRIFLAPMESVVDHHFRALYGSVGGIDVMVSEFVRVNEQPVTVKTLLRECPELERAGLAPGGVSATADGTPVRLQLLGSNPATLAESAALAASMGAAAIDLNFGCPAKTVNKSRGGSVLLKEPELVGRIVAAVRAAVPLALPVTAKIRLGFEARDLYMDNARAIAAAGASELCVHARSRADGYRPPAYWSCIAEIRAAVSIPVVANGEIWSVADWRRCKAESGATDFMLGRGLLACPDLAREIRAADAGTDYCPMTWAQILPLVRTLYDATRDQYPRRFLGNRVKQWLHYLSLHYAPAAAFFARVKRLQQPEEFEAAFARERAAADDAAAREIETKEPVSALAG